MEWVPIEKSSPLHSIILHHIQLRSYIRSSRWKSACFSLLFEIYSSFISSSWCFIFLTDFIFTLLVPDFLFLAECSKCWSIMALPTMYDSLLLFSSLDGDLLLLYLL